MDSGQPFYIIGTDGGFLESTVQIDEFILMSAERVDVIIDFSNNTSVKTLWSKMSPRLPVLKHRGLAILEQLFR